VIPQLWPRRQFKGDTVMIDQVLWYTGLAVWAWVAIPCLLAIRSASIIGR
jgi:hypothetical protein